ncbi:hypothetical protein ACT89R_29810 (plasmid) [Rhodococcus qingshengii]
MSNTVSAWFGVAMTKTCALALCLASALVLLVAGCSAIDPPLTPAASTAVSSPWAPVDTATQDTGRYGIVVPAVAANPTHIDPDSISFDLPGMSFEDAAQWMQAHLPLDDAIDEMKPCGEKVTPTMHSWYWGAGTNEATLSVTVFAAPITQIGIFGGTNSMDC